MYLNYLGNYVPNSWNYEHGCSHCDDDIVDLSRLKVSVKIETFSPLFAVPYLKCSCGKCVFVDTGKVETSPCLPVWITCVCLDSRSIPQFAPLWQISRTTGSAHTPTKIGYVPVGPFGPFWKSTSARETPWGRGSPALLWCRIWLLGFLEGFI